MIGVIEHNVIEVLQNADEPLHISEIVKRSGETEYYVKKCIREHANLGNIDTVHTKSRNGNRYEWIGVLGLSEEINRLSEELDVLETHETPKPEGDAPVGKMESKQSAYMVVVDGETSLLASKDKADELAAQQAKSEASVFIYEIVSVNQVVYKPTVVAHDLASLCS